MHGGEANNSGALRRDMSGRALLTVLVVGVAAVLAVGVGTLTALRLSSPRSSPTPKAAGTTGASRGTTKPTIQLQVVSTSPTAGATVAPDAAVSVTFSTPVDPSGPLPTLSPAIAGSWMAATPTTLAFHPDGPLPPASALTLSVPGGTQGVHGVDGSHLAVSTTVGFNVQPGTTVRLQQLLAQLGYLPVTFTPAGSPPPAVQMADTQAGSFSWRWPNLPAQLTALWQPGVYNEMTKAAVMAFEEANQLAVDGIAGPEVWQTLLHDATVGAHDPNPYSYVLVSKVSPETLNLWVNGASRFQNVLVLRRRGYRTRLMGRKSIQVLVEIWKLVGYDDFRRHKYRQPHRHKTRFGTHIPIADVFLKQYLLQQTVRRSPRNTPVLRQTFRYRIQFLLILGVHDTPLFLRTDHPSTRRHRKRCALPAPCRAQPLAGC
jgi:peptidoglycan hydrolase-like protein with peptidoglycan-binding domain